VIDRSREGEALKARDAARIARWVRVGRRRVLLALDRAGGGDRPCEEALPDEPEVLAWVARARGAQDGR
jgi:hypothetical protein